MSKESTETYLNLNSDQFNSWIQEFDNKYNQVEKEFLSKDNNHVQNLILSDSENSVEIESDSDSDNEDDNNSNVFIKQENSRDFSYSESSVDVQSSSQKRRLLFNKTRIRSSNVDSNETTSNQLKLNENNKETNSKRKSQERRKPERKSSERNSSNVNAISNDVKDKSISIDYEILSLNQLNSILPEFNFQINKQASHVKQSAIINENIQQEKKGNNNSKDIKIEGITLKNSQYNTRLGEAALYRFIGRRKY